MSARSLPAAPEQASRSWSVSLALLFCFAVVSSGLHTVFQGFEWLPAIYFVVLVALVSAAIVRALPPHRGRRKRGWMPTLVAGLCLLGVLTLMFAARTALLFVLPTSATFTAFVELAKSGSESISAQSVPAEVTGGILFLLCLGVGAISIVTDLFAVTLKRPALAGAPLLVTLAVPAFIGVDLSDFLTFLLAAAGFLWLLRSGQPWRQTGRSIGLGAVAILIAIILPLILPPTHEELVTNSAFSGYLAGVNPVLNLGAELRRETARLVLDYHSESDSPQYLRLVSLQNFTAETWEPDPPVIDRRNTPDAVGAPPGLAKDVLVEPNTTWINVSNLGSPWLPVPYPATSVSGLSGDWYWDAQALTFSSPNRTARGEDFEVASVSVRPTPGQLLNAGSVVPSGLSKFLELPPGLPTIISSTARQVVANAPSNYAKALALQEFFRDGSFQYSESAPIDEGYDGTGMEVLAKFLVARSGYCVHFASAMAVMARTLGIPSRVAVGFIPGTKGRDLVDEMSSFNVTTRDLHTWPELYFDGIGWIRFEPTPGRGFVPSYADEAAPGVPEIPTAPVITAPETTAAPTPTPSSSPTSSDGNRDLEGNANAGGIPEGALLLGVFVAMALLLLLLVPALVRMLQRWVRMRRLSRGAGLAKTGWREILQLAEDLRIEVDRSATPRQISSSLAQALTGSSKSQVEKPAAKTVEPEEKVLNEKLAPLRAVVAAVERASFARPTQSKAGQSALHSAAPDLALVSQVACVVMALREKARFGIRLRAALAPPSIWAAMFGWLSVSDHATVRRR